MGRMDMRFELPLRKMESIEKLPQLQTGCEATALTTVSNYHGFSVKKTSIVDQYMPIRRKGFGNINQTFLGNPVCVWMTCNINKKPQTHIRWTYKGKKYSFSYDEHCVAVIGFNRKKDTVIVANPLNGICSHPRKSFAKRYKEMGKRALVIR